MADEKGWLEHRLEEGRLLISVGGDWRISGLALLDPALRQLAALSAQSAAIDLEKISHIDTAGAWTLYRTRRDLAARGVTAEFSGVNPAQRTILDRIAETDQAHDMERDELSPIVAMIERMGKAAFAVCDEAAAFLSFMGATVVSTLHVILNPRRIRFTSLMSHIEQVGLNAVPIVGLLSFLIGVVLAYQGADQLRRFGAEIFTVNLVGVAVLREMAILLTAIIIAGRSGSAFTAQIGTMQVNQEIDAMRTLGLDPIEVLVLPRVFALFIALPLLAVYADFMGLAGGIFMSILVLDISFVQFIERLKLVVPLTAFWVGIVKAPVFGIVIALVGCREGMNVSGSAESVGRQTTRSVVVSIFMVIIIDAIFSIIFSFLRI